MHVPEINVCSNVSFKYLNESSSSFLFGFKDNYLAGYKKGDFIESRFDLLQARI